MAKDTEGSGKKDSEPRKEEGPSLERKEPEQMKKETDKEGEMVAEAPEAPEADEQQVEQAPEASEEEADSAPAELSPDERAEQLVKENEELQDKFVRLMADFDNYRKRASKEKSDVIQFGNEGLLKDILPIIDNIERLLTYSYGEGSWKSFQEGIELVLAEITRPSQSTEWSRSRPWARRSIRTSIRRCRGPRRMKWKRTRSWRSIRRAICTAAGC